MNEKILIVEDNKTNRKLITILLSMENYEIRAATDAYEALQTLNSFQPVLILMDIQLPGMDGLELTRKLKNDARYKNIPVIAITAYAMKGDKEKALAAGCVDYVTKPLDPKSFLETIAKYLH